MLMIGAIAAILPRTPSLAANTPETSERTEAAGSSSAAEVLIRAASDCPASEAPSVATPRRPAAGAKAARRPTATLSTADTILASSAASAAAEAELIVSMRARVVAMSVHTVPT